MRRAIVLFLLMYSFLAAETTLERIDRAYKSGLITFDDYYLYRAYFVFEPEKLPLWLRGDADKPFCATPIVFDLNEKINNLSAEVATIIRRYLVRPSLDREYISPSGRFKLHYTLTGDNAVPSIEYVQRFANYFDVAYMVEVDTVGCFPPPPDGSMGGDSRYDVYIVRIPSRTYGYTQTETVISDTAWSMVTSYIIVRNEYEGFYSPEDGAMRTTAAHEFHHAIIFGYNYNTPSWWQEPNCVTMEDRVADDVNDCYQYLSAFYTYPERSLMVVNGSHEYGYFVFVKYLLERFGDSFLPDFWYRMAYLNDVINALDQVLGTRGTSFDNEFALFHSWNYVTGSRDDGRHFREGMYYPEVDLVGSHSSYPVSGATSAYPPDPLAANFVRFINDYSGGILNLNFSGGSSAQWKLKIVKKLGRIYYDEDFPVSGTIGNLTISDWSRYPELALVVVNISRTGSATNFNYSATVSGTAYLPPRNLSATYWQNGVIPLSWQPPSSGSPSRYKIYRAEISGGPYSFLSYSYTSSYNDNTVINGRIYYYVVSAEYSGNESGYSNQAAAIAGPGGGTIDTLIIDNRNEVYYYGGNANLRLANLFTLEHFPSRIVALQFNLHDPGAYSAEIRKVSGGSIGELVWQGGGYAGSSGWSEITVSDEVIVFGSSAFFPETSFAVAFKPSYDDQKLWASDNNSGRSFYWNGATWVSVPLTFMIRAIVERFGSLSIRETSSVAVDFKIYPNPFNEAFIVEFPYYEQGYLLDIFDITGKRRNSDVEVKGLNGYFYLKPVRMNSGIYFLKVKSGERVFTGKVIYLR